MTVFLIILGIALLVLAWLISKSVCRTMKEHAIVEGDVLYSDLNPESITKPLFSSRHGLAGKPDYIVRRGNEIIPVEIKNTLANAPYENHVLQMAAYCLLIEENYRTRVPYGYLVYGNRKQFRIEFDERLREELLGVINEIRSLNTEEPVERNHNSRAKCMACSFRDKCPARID